MSKSKKERCQHGNSPVYMQGCPHCVQDAMTGLHIMQDNGITVFELWELLRMAYPDKAAWDAGVIAAKERVVKQKMKAAEAGTKP